ncbi:hypothetical protein IPA_01255 [Ignicoccus pacificus DSM 13166]|uniref:DUF2341 domain-containing protein n=1 Tax=Ignicoccus pacificus DSM 13166 TaxID=940294 RepID=A0A977KBY7_9CREN|nr:hypothetical protein IPA_01255 [Ignicoccus pacificus DSM 13166]
MKAIALSLLLVSLAFAQSYLMIVHNPNSQALTDFQVRAKLPSSLQGQAITIKDTSGNLVPFCYETLTGECTTDPAQGDEYIWVKIPSIPANGDTKLVIEVGVNGAVKGDKVFDFYDDFNEGYLDESKWARTIYAQVYKLGNSFLLEPQVESVPFGGNNYIYSVYYIYPNNIIEMDVTSRKANVGGTILLVRDPLLPYHLGIQHET